MDDENRSKEYVGGVGIDRERSHHERIDLLMNGVLTRHEWARGTSLAAQRQSSREYYIKFREYGDPRSRSLGETLVKFYNYTLRRQDETVDGFEDDFDLLCHQSKLDNNTQDACDEDVEQEAIRCSTTFDNGENRSQAETVRCQNEENGVENKESTDNPRAVMVKVKRKLAFFLTGMNYYLEDVPPKQAISQHYPRPLGRFLFITIPCLGQDILSGVRLRKKPSLLPSNYYMQGKLVGGLTAYQTVDNNATDGSSSNSSISLLEYNFRSESEIPEFDRLQKASKTEAAGEHLVVHQAWFIFFDDETIRAFGSADDQPGDLAQLPHQRVGAYLSLLGMIEDAVSSSETEISNKFSQRVSDLEFLVQTRDGETPTQANLGNELALRIKATSFELQAIINVVGVQTKMLQTLAGILPGGNSEGLATVHSAVNAMVEDRKFFCSNIGLILSKLQNSQQRLTECLLGVAVKEHTRTVSQQPTLVTAESAFVVQGTERAEQESTMALNETAKVLEGTNRDIRNQCAKPINFITIAAISTPLTLLSSRWGRNLRGVKWKQLALYILPSYQGMNFNGIANTRWKQLQLWKLSRPSVAFFSLVVSVLALQRSIRKKAEWESTKTSKEIADVSGGSNRRTENQDSKLFIFTIITAIFIPISFLTSYLGMNLNGTTTTKRNQIKLWELSGPVTIIVTLVTWGWAFQRTISEESKKATRGSIKESKETANVLEETSRHTESQGDKLSIVTFITAMSTPITLLTSYWGTNLNGTAAIQWNQIELWGLWISTAIAVFSVVWWWAFRHTISRENKKATQKNAMGSKEILKVLEETNRLIEHQNITISIFTLITAIFTPLGFLTSYRGMNFKGTTAVPRNQIELWGLWISAAIVVLFMIWGWAFRHTIGRENKKPARESTKASKEIAKVSGGSNRRTKNQDSETSIFTISTIFFLLGLLASYWGANPVQWNQIKLWRLRISAANQIEYWKLCVAVMLFIPLTVWGCVFRRTIREKLSLCVLALSLLFSRAEKTTTKGVYAQQIRNNDQGSLHSVDTKSPYRSLDPGASCFEDTMWRFKYMISRLEFSIMRAPQRCSETLPTRVSWKCSCDTIIFDDFLELAEGGSLSTIPSSSGVKQHSNISRIRRLLLNLSLPSFAKLALGRKTIAPAGLPNPGAQISNSSLSSTRTDNLITNNRYLLLCYNNRWDSIRLLHLDVPPSRKDQELFAQIRHAYYTARGWWRCLFSLRVLRRIEFVKFELYYVEDVDICARNDLPGPTVKHYEYIPRPAETVPPVGPNTFMHFFHNPDHAPTFDHLLNRMPKKLDGRVTIEADASTEFGWGIHFVEELSRVRVLVMSFVVLLICSLFAILWTIIKHDIQGGFGVAGFLAAALAVFIGIICVQIMVY